MKACASVTETPFANARRALRGLGPGLGPEKCLVELAAGELAEE